MLTSRSPPIKLLDFLHLSIDWSSVKIPSLSITMILAFVNELKTTRALECCAQPSMMSPIVWEILNSKYFS